MAGDFLKPLRILPVPFRNNSRLAFSSFLLPRTLNRDRFSASIPTAAAHTGQNLLSDPTAAR